METRNRAYHILATIGAFHQAIRGTESLPLIPRPTYFRIWQTPLITDRVVADSFNDHDPPAVVTIDIALGCLIGPCRYASWSERSSSLRPWQPKPHSLINLMNSQSIFPAAKQSVAIAAIGLTLLWRAGGR